MKRPETIGLILNPKAGKGYVYNIEIARQVAHRFKGSRIITGPDELGAEALAVSQAEFEICPCDPAPGRQQTVILAAALARRKVDLLVVIGGDGTLSDVVCGLVDLSQAPPVLGIGTGSTNVGPLITCQATEIERLYPWQLETRPVPAVLARDHGTLLGVGLNDCVIGFTVVGTLDGIIRNLDARAKMDGQNLPGEPRSVGTPQTLVQRISPQQTIEIGQGEWIGCVVIGFAESGFFGKAITGGVCLASFTHAPAGCLVADIPLVQVELTREQVLALPSLRSQYTSFGENMSIRVKGVKEGAAVCADGNPLKLLTPEDQVDFFVQPEAIQAVRLNA